MQTDANYFMGSDSQAYRSEISLFRHTGETADDCWMMSARAGAKMLYEVVGPGDRISITADLAEATAKFLRTEADGFHSIPVVD
jgi:hypothetical protein